MPGLLDRRLLLVTGKGGTGRTTIATALGLAAAARGKRTIVCEVAQDRRISRMFRSEGVGYVETELRPNLSAIWIDPQHALEEYLSQQLGSRRLMSLLVRSRIFEHFVAAAPGLRELTVIGKVWELAQHERRADGPVYDLVILDAPASGHGLAMLRTPRTYGDIARVGPIRRQAGRIRDFLSNPDVTGIVAVALPQEMPVTETLEFGELIRAELGFGAGAVVMNAVLPERFSAEEAARIEDAIPAATPPAEPALRAALSEHRRARSQRAQLRRLRRHVDRVVTLPQLWEPELGLDELDRIATELGRKL